MENPIEMFDKLSKKQKILVVGGSVGIAGILWWRAKNKATDVPSDQTDSTTTDTSAYDSGGVVQPDYGYNDGGYGGGYGGGGYVQAPGTQQDPSTSTVDGTTPETPVVNVAAPDFSSLADAISSLQGSDNGPTDLIPSGGGMPSTPDSMSRKMVTLSNGKVVSQAAVDREKAKVLAAKQAVPATAAKKSGTGGTHAAEPATVKLSNGKVVSKAVVDRVKAREQAAAKAKKH